MYMIKNIDRHKVLLILNWCQKRYGKSQYRRKPAKIRVYKSYGISVGKNKYNICNGLYGYQEEDTITIFLGLHTSIKELCNTIIHEYKHYLLNEREWNLLYRKLEKSGITDSYDIIYKHPHEKEAIKFEKKYGPICYKELKNKLYKKF
jgi:hypothetical protein